MVVVLDRKCLEASLIQMSAAGRVMVSVPALRVRQRQPAQKRGQFAILFRPKEEMPMVRHETIAEQPNVGPVHRFDKNPLERLEIGILLEQRPPGHASIGRMVNITPGSDASDSWHDSNL